MSLQAKILQLKLEAALAVKHANGWQRLIDLYGESKATAFYTHLGLNHLPVKSVEHDGLTLRRQPRDAEALAVKGVAQAQDTGKAKLTALLLATRLTMITDALEQIADLNPADYHTLIVAVPAAQKNLVKTALVDVFNNGRHLVALELARVKQDELDEDDLEEFDELDLLSDVATSRVANDTQSRIIAAASRLAMLGTIGVALINAVQTEIGAGSVSYIDRAATGLANRTISLGRGYEAEQRNDEWERVEYSALLDNNVCSPCADADGETATNEADLTPAPNPECEGYDNCRCFHVWVRD
jgi:hypothetical protein